MDPSKETKPKERKESAALVKYRQWRDRTEEDKDRAELERLDRLKQENKKFLYGVFTVLRHINVFLRKNTNDNVSALAGHSSLFILLSIIPFFVFIFMLGVILTGDTPSVAQEAKIAETYNESTAKATYLITAFLNGIYESHSHTILISAIIALWSAGKGMYIITDGISRIYGLQAKHTWLFRRVFAMGYTIVMMLMLILTSQILMFSKSVEQSLNSAAKDIPIATATLYALRYVISTAFMVLALTLLLKLYLWRKVTDKRYTKFRVLLPGMLFSAIGWSLLTYGVELYVKYFTTSLYGSLGTVIIIILWVYFFMYLFLCGIQLNYLYREQFYAFGFRKVFAALGRRIRRKKQPQTKS